MIASRFKKNNNHTAFFMLIVSIALFAVSNEAVSQKAAGKDDLPLSTYTVTRAMGQLIIDGKLDEADWQQAIAAPMNNSKDGSPNPLKTTMKLLWDDSYLYAGIYCEDNDAWATYTEFDGRLWEEEVVELFIDPDGLEHVYYEVEYNPLGNVVDLVVMNAGKRKNGKFTGWFGWNFDGMKHAVYVEGSGHPGTNDKYWSVEIAFPFDNFWVAANIPPKDGDMWRLNAYRNEREYPDRKNTKWQAASSPVGADGFHAPWRFGKIYFKK